MKLIIKYILGIAVTAAVFAVCVVFGSGNFVEDAQNAMSNIVFTVRLPRVICVALIGAGLSICGVAMQGLLRNPLADGTTLGVSSGASLGAVIAIVIGGALPAALSGAGTVVFAMLFAFGSLALIMGLAYRLDTSLSTNTIILVGVVFGMFASALISLLIAMFPEHVQTITFWTMGSVTGVNYQQCAMLAVLIGVGLIIVAPLTRDLNALAIGEENASHLGVNVRRSKVLLMLATAIMIGGCVSVAGTIGFVGLVVPHISRMIVGPNNRRVLPFAIFFGADFLMLTDLVSRTIIAPKELPIGVITSLIGSVIFIYIFYKQRKRK